MTNKTFKKENINSLFASIRRGFTLMEILVVIAIIAIVSSFIIYNNSGEIPLANAEKSLKEVELFSDALVKEISKEASAPRDSALHVGYFDHATGFANCNLPDGNLLVPNLCVDGILVTNKLYSIFPNIDSVLPPSRSSVIIIGVAQSPTISSTDYRSGLALNSATVRITTEIKVGKIPAQKLSSAKLYLAKKLQKYGASSSDLTTWNGRTPYITITLERNLKNLRDMTFFKNYLSLRVKPAPPANTVKDYFNIHLPLFEQYIYTNTNRPSVPKKTVYVVWAPDIGAITPPASTTNNYVEATVPVNYTRLCVISNMIYDENSSNCFNTSTATSESIAQAVYNEFVKLGFVSPPAATPTSYRGLFTHPNFKVKKYHRFY